MSEVDEKTEQEEEKYWEKCHKIFPVYALMGIDTRQDIFSSIAELASDGMTFVETGVFTGGSFCFLGNELNKRNKTVSMNAVDNFLFENISPESEDEVCDAHGEEWRGRLYDLFIHNLETYNLTDMTTIHAKDSIEASKDFEDNSIDFIHFDGDHNPNYVREEIQAWLPKLKEDSIIAGHDYKWLHPVIDSVFGKQHVWNVNNESYLVRIGQGF